MSAGPPAAPAHAVLFDMDGLLVDTESAWHEVEDEIMVRLGGTWRAEDKIELVGGSMARTVEFMLRRSGATVSPPVLRRWLVDAMHARLRAGVTMMPGARELLGRLAAAGVPLALVTSAERVLMDVVLETVGRHHFRVVVCADDVIRTKPHPEPYLLAAHRLGLHPSGCVVLEDSVNGVLAAEAAGCAVVAVPSVLPVPVAPGRTIVSSLLEIDATGLRALVRWNGDRPAPLIGGPASD